MFRHLATAIVFISLFAINGCDDVPDLSLPNEPPIARDDSVTIRQNQVAAIPILANDTDIDGDPLVVSTITDTTNGELENLGSTIIYTPDQYFIGSDSFTYQISDSAGHTAMATVSIEVAKHETRAVFSTTSGGEQKLGMIDSRDPATLVDLGQALDAGELILNWGISQTLQQAVLLTDADRIVTIPFDDPATPAVTIDIDTTDGAVDGGLVITTGGDRAMYTLANRHVVYFDLTDELTPFEVDSTFDTGTMMPAFSAPVTAPVINDTALIMQGTLGAGAEERSAIYSVPLNVLQPPVVILDDPDTLETIVTRPARSVNAMLWLTDSAMAAPAPAAYSCAMPPPQTLSPVSFTVLGAPGPGTDLIEASGLMTDPTDVISLNNGDRADRLLVAACPPDIDIVQIIDIPFTAPENARIVATADDASDGLWNIDVARLSNFAMFTIDGDMGLRTRMIDLSETDPVISDIAAPGFQTYTVNTEVRLPPSLFSTDALRWLYLAPVNDELTQLHWLQLDTMAVTSVDLPFAATTLESDGFHAVVQAGTGNMIALIDLNDSTVTTISVDGVLDEPPSDVLNQIESTIDLYDIP